MKLWSTEELYGRREIHVHREGVSIKYLRSRVGGGWYTRDSSWISWPWKKGS